MINKSSDNGKELDVDPDKSKSNINATLLLFYFLNSIIIIKTFIQLNNCIFVTQLSETKKYLAFDTKIRNK